MTPNSIALPTGEIVTGRKIQDTLNKCDTVADAFLLQQAEIKAKDQQIAMLTAENANLREQVVEYEKTNALYEKAVAALTTALDAKTEASAARDSEIKMLKERVKQLESRKTAMWKKILMIVAGIVLGRVI